MRYSFVICDVFTQETFGGNPLAVITNAEGLSSTQMQKIAREFNFSETTFVLPPENNGDYRVRIFTSSSEMPFAGHPNIGTAHVLASQGKLNGKSSFLFEELAGVVPVHVTKQNTGEAFCELTAPEPITTGLEFPAELLATVLTLPVEDICTDKHLPVVASVGLGFVMVELKSVQALQSIRVNTLELEALSELMATPLIHAYVRTEDDFDIRARMFAPTDGVPEDPATGSANCALAGLLASLNPEPNLVQTLRIAQGIEMGRPSELLSKVEKVNGEVTSVKIGGYAVTFCEGELTV